MTSPPIIRISVGVVLNSSGTHVLMAKRLPGKPFAGMWEYPGGKIEPGETPAQCLVRELKEELDITVDLAKLDVAENREPDLCFQHRYENCIVDFAVFVVTRYAGIARGAEGQDIEWIHIDSGLRHPHEQARQVPEASHTITRFLLQKI